MNLNNYQQQITSLSSKKSYCHGLRQPLHRQCNKINGVKKDENFKRKTKQNVKCSSCFTVLVDRRTMFYTKKCDSYFCQRCLSKSQVKQNILILPCGHQVLHSQILYTLQQYCYKCGEDFDRYKDYELLDYRKICVSCIEFHRKEVENDLIKCLNCEKNIRLSSEAGEATKDIIVCKTCYFTSKSKELQHVINSQIKQNVSPKQLQGNQSIEFVTGKLQKKLEVEVKKAKSCFKQNATIKSKNNNYRKENENPESTKKVKFSEKEPEVFYYKNYGDEKLCSNGVQESKCQNMFY